VDAKHFWNSEGVKEASFPGTSVKMSSFCAHNSAPLLVLCLQCPLRLSLSHTFCFSTAVAQRKHPACPAPLQTSGEVACSLASSPVQLFCCTKAAFVKVAFRKPLKKKCLPMHLRFLECSTAEDEACENVTRLGLNYHMTYF